MACICRMRLLLLLQHLNWWQRQQKPLWKLLHLLNVSLYPKRELEIRTSSIRVRARFRGWARGRQRRRLRSQWQTFVRWYEQNESTVYFECIFKMRHFSISPTRATFTRLTESAECDCRRLSICRSRSRSRSRNDNDSHSYSFVINSLWSISH